MLQFTDPKWLHCETWYRKYLIIITLPQWTTEIFFMMHNLVVVKLKPLWVLLWLFRVFFVCLLFCMLMYFFTFCMFSPVVCKFRWVYFCVVPSCSFSASLLSGTLLTTWFSEPRCQHFGKPFSLLSVLYFPLSFLPSSVSNLY